MVEVFLNNSTKKIEGRYHQSKDTNAPVVLILHHHPQYGGSMDSKIIHSIYESFIDNNFSALTINFRGVGKSTGTFDKGIGELTDAAVAIDWLQEHNSNNVPIWVVGFSFGAWVAMQLTMRRPEIVSFVALSLPATKYDFSFLSPCPVPGLIIQSNNDTISEEGDVTELAQRLINSIKSDHMEYYIVDNTNHFLRDKEEEVVQIIDNYIKLRLNSAATSSKKAKKEVRVKEYA
ncbi:alpha/beta superfamily hydrolase [Wolbachia endosymbiont of Armadillidium vulgare str. wVulC]|uniref:Alpha/beta fold hydrolase n=1 Tax=Wolbachia endosymbiont of Armadillidium arcangelii TaxID=3158571 RepID=A0AAU7Q1I2_9RICK|nr:alpha/beta fold hydrolase [Wolbachia endosymbiont of Armadillidium vulgare]KLT22479.1 alpha/beta superfamily hydrolase [Wolbachia endosymbiont of Armadillidium vulgare str. wVulC]OJH32853.1 Putative aminoacrylate hydrolase RutD [Wolbachia endosymbiont of Armadillidium vulgare]